MSASLTRKYLRTLEERDTALRQVRELQAQLVTAQQQAAATAARDAEVTKMVSDANAKILKLTDDVEAAQRTNKELTAKLEGIEERRKAAAAERAARKQPTPSTAG